MKANKDALSTAKRIFHLCLENGKVNEEKFRKSFKLIGARKPRNYHGILLTLKRLIQLELAKSHVTIESAQPLNSATQKEVESSLTKQHGDSLTFEYQVKQELLGGIRIRKADDVWDNSIKARLEKLANAF